MKIQSVTALSGTLRKLFFTTAMDGIAPTVPIVQALSDSSLTICLPSSVCLAWSVVA